MNTVKPAGSHAVSDPAGEQSGTEQLTGRDHAVLVCSEARDRRLPSRFVAFLRHIRRKATTPPISPPFTVGVRPARRASSLVFAPALPRLAAYV
jgi:hypothetical protein